MGAALRPPPRRSQRARPHGARRRRRATRSSTRRRSGPHALPAGFDPAEDPRTQPRSGPGPPGPAPPRRHGQGSRGRRHRHPDPPRSRRIRRPAALLRRGQRQGRPGQFSRRARCRPSWPAGPAGSPPKPGSITSAATTTTISAELRPDVGHYARAMDQLLEVNARLPPDRRIRVLSISAGWGPDDPGFKAMNAAVRRAAAVGIFVVSANVFDASKTGLWFWGLDRAGGDPADDPGVLSGSRVEGLDLTGGRPRRVRQVLHRAARGGRRARTARHPGGLEKMDSPLSGTARSVTSRRASTGRGSSCQSKRRGTRTAHTGRRLRAGSLGASERQETRRWPAASSPISSRTSGPEASASASARTATGSCRATSTAPRTRSAPPAASGLMGSDHSNNNKFNKID